MTADTMTAGACVCGLVRFEVGPPYHWFSFCHCSICRRHHGALASCSIGVQSDRFRWLQGREAIRSYRHGATFERAFCRRCASKVPAGSGVDGTVNVPAGLLDDDLDAHPRTHIFVASRSPAFPLTDGLPAFDAYPPGVPPSLTPLPDVQPTGSDSNTSGLTGACACGQVRFCSDQLPQWTFHCHCRRCRRSRGTPFATHAIVPLMRFRWTAGEAHRMHWTMPGARYFATDACEHCGSLLPTVIADNRLVCVPAGSIDQQDRLRPEAHVHVASRARWFRITDALPQFDAEAQNLPPQ